MVAQGIAAADRLLDLVPAPLHVVHAVDAMTVSKKHTPPRHRKHLRSITQPRNSCLFCGGHGHNAGSCPLGGSRKQEKALVTAVYDAAGKEARKDARNKYTNPRQQAKCYAGRPRQRSRVAVSRSLLDISRAPPLVLAKWLIEDGLLSSLEGVPCPYACGGSSKGYGPSRPVLAKLTGDRSYHFDANASVLDISRASASCRCQNCRNRVRVTKGSRLFGLLSTGCGALSVSKVVHCWWSYLEDKSVTTTCREINVDEKTVSACYDVARLVCDYDYH